MAVSRRGFQYCGDAVGIFRAESWQSRDRRAIGEFESGDDAFADVHFSPRCRIVKFARDHRRSPHRCRNNIGCTRQVSGFDSIFQGDMTVSTKLSGVTVMSKAMQAERKMW